MCLRCYPGCRGCVAGEAPPLRMDRPASTAADHPYAVGAGDFPSPVRDFPMQRRSPSSARCPGSVAWRSVAFSVSKALEFPPASLTDRPGVFLRCKILAYFADFLLYLLLSGCSIVSVLPSAAPNMLYWLSHWLAGVIAWTLIEFPVHKYVLQLALFPPAPHAAHHDAPTGLIRTPLWASLPVMLVTFAVTVGVAGSTKGGVAGAGVVICCLRRLALRRAALGSFEVLLSARCSIFAARHHMALAHPFGTKASERRRPSSGLAMR